MQTKSAKAKGRRLQDWVREQLLRVFALTPEQVRTRVMGEKGEDVVVADPAWDLAVECKNQERVNVWTAYTQARAHAGSRQRIPVVVLKKNRHTPLVALAWDDFIRIATLRTTFQGLVRFEQTGPVLSELKRLAGWGKMLEEDVARETERFEQERKEREWFDRYNQP